MRINPKILSIFLVFSLQGCTLWDYLKPPEREVVPPQGNLGEARELLHSFLQARIAGESEDRLRAYLTEEAWNDYKGGKLTLQSTEDEQLVGYKIRNESELTEGRFAFTAVLQKVIPQPPAAENIAEDIIVSFREEEYRISSARFLEKTKVEARNGDLVLSGLEDDEPQQVTVFNIKNLPAEMTPLGAGPEIKFGVGREGYSTVVLNPDNRGAAFGSRGTHGIIALLNWDEKVFTENQGKEVKLTPVDLAFEGSAKLMAFSPDSKYLAVEMQEATGNSRVRIYRTGEIKRMVPELNQAFPPEDYSIFLNRWEPDGKTVLLRINAGQGGREIDRQKLGTWAVNVETGEREKIVGQ